MNFGLVLVALMMAGAAIVGIFAIANAANTPYTDTFGNVSTTATNTSQGIVTNATAPLTGGASGVIIIIAVMFLFVCAVFVIKAAFGNNNGRR